MDICRLEGTSTFSRRLFDRSRVDVERSCIVPLCLHRRKRHQPRYTRRDGSRGWATREGRIGSHDPADLSCGRGRSDRTGTETAGRPVPQPETRTGVNGLCGRVRHADVDDARQRQHDGSCRYAKEDLTIVRERRRRKRGNGKNGAVADDDDDDVDDASRRWFWCITDTRTGTRYYRNKVAAERCLLLG